MLSFLALNFNLDFYISASAAFYQFLYSFTCG